MMGHLDGILKNNKKVKITPNAMIQKRVVLYNSPF